MSAIDHLGTYAEGWTKGDADIIASAVKDDFTFDDPDFGVVTKDQLSNYLNGLKESVASLSEGQASSSFMELTEVLTQEADGELTAWCWWNIPGTELKGSGLIKADSTGIRNEVITYYAKPGG